MCEGRKCDLLSHPVELSKSYRDSVCVGGRGGGECVSLWDNLLEIDIHVKQTSHHYFALPYRCIHLNTQ